MIPTNCQVGSFDLRRLWCSPPRYPALLLPNSLKASIQIVDLGQTAAVTTTITNRPGDWKAPFEFDL
jgi:hypothetical protein